MLTKLNELDDKYPYTYLTLYSTFTVAYLAVTLSQGAAPIVGERLFALVNSLAATFGVSYFLL